MAGSRRRNQIRNTTQSKVTTRFGDNRGVHSSAHSLTHGVAHTRASASSPVFTPAHASPAAPSDMFFPQPMEIAFSLEAGSFSSDLFDMANTAAAGATAGTPSSMPNAFVVCFEDVLMPIKWMMQNLGLRATVQHVHQAKERAVRNPYVHESLARVEQLAIQLLTTVAARGPVCLLSEHSARFVELVCQTFFPRLAYCLSSPQVLTNVQVIGAPTKFTTSTERMNWRVNLLQALVKDQLFAGATHLLLDMRAGRFGLCVASPHQVDAVACSKALDVAPFLVPKSIRVANARTMSLDHFMLHLQTLSQYLVEAAPCTSAFSVEL